MKEIRTVADRVSGLGKRGVVTAFAAHPVPPSNAVPTSGEKLTQGVAASGKILIVEDEPLVRLLAVEILESAGFQCVEAGSGKSALDALTKDPRAFAAALIDLGLPDRPGDQVAVEIFKLRADLAVLIVSGRDEAEIKQRLKGYPVAVVLKPYTGALLLDALEKLGVKAPG